MSRSIHEERFLSLLKSELQESPLTKEELAALFSDINGEQWQQVMQLATANRACPVMMGGLARNPGLPISVQMLGYLQQSMFQSSMAFYQKFSLVGSLLELMKQENVHGCVLKGVALSALFPTAESRTFSDIDLYVPDREEYHRLINRLIADGAEKIQDDLTDYHESFQYRVDAVSCETEVHYRLTTHWNNGDFDERLSRIYEEGIRSGQMGSVELMGVEIPTLPVTLEALYLLMHLFQHFMNKGFGIRLFLDWAIFWKRKGEQVDADCLSSWLRELHLGKFADAINRVCVNYLGMKEPPTGWFSPAQGRDLVDELLDDVFAGGDFGHQDKNRMIVTTRKTGLRGYFLELDRQTKKRFRRASRIRILLPVLWLLSAIIFEYNNIFRRKISLGNVFHSSSQRYQLVQKMDIFDER